MVVVDRCVVMLVPEGDVRIKDAIEDGTSTPRLRCEM